MSDVFTKCFQSNFSKWCSAVIVAVVPLRGIFKCFGNQPL